MKTYKFENTTDWLEARKGKITGSRLKDIIVKRGTGEKIGFYELIAERLTNNLKESESPMDRGTRLEPEAIAKFAEITKKEVNTDLVIFTREDNESIAISPDGYIGNTEAVEVKCLSSARHIEAYLTQLIPSEYIDQVKQYFVVNDDLQKLYLVFYDPRILCKTLFHLEINRSDYAENELAECLEYQKAKLQAVDEIVLKLINY